ncbi:MAG: Oxygen sensor histidine kinase NreB [Pseudomonadota bacterium]
MHRHDDPAGELSELRARLLHLEAELRIRDEFIIAAAHELRNPISPLVLQVHRLRTAAGGASDGAVSASWLHDQCELLAKRLGRFTSALNRILDVSRLHSGRIDLVFEDGVDLSEVVREVVAGFERELAASRSELTLEVPAQVRGSWDRMRLEQIVSNLVSNAIRYGNSSPIRVSLTHTSDTAQLLVNDLGVGIAEADQERIFERFERGPTRNRAGFGVGLWIVRQLCEAMGGTVSVESSPGEGSQFCVELPLKRLGSDDDR